MLDKNSQNSISHLFGNPQTYGSIPQNSSLESNPNMM
jgi:hypothetical protein